LLPRIWQMQPASDIFLGWVTGRTGQALYVRQLRDAKLKPLVEMFDAEVLDIYAMVCGWVLPRAHSKVSELSSTIGGYLGASSDEFDVAMGKFAVVYADQAERDHAALKAAVKKGKVKIYQES
jgi:acid phosphatase family membrane protein YuiD